MYSSSFSARSEIKVEEYTVSWVLHDFNKNPPFRNRPFRGPVFTLGSEVKSKWALLICKELLGEESMGFSLTKDHANQLYEVVKYSIVIKSDDGRSVQCLTDVFTSGSSDESFQHIKINNFSAEDRIIFRSKVLIVMCSIDYVYHKEDEKPVEHSESKPFVDAMEYLHDKKPFSDITLCANDGTEFKCHKVICLRSTVLSKMCGDLKGDNYLDLGIDKKSAKAMIFYIYTRQIPHVKDYERYAKLHVAAQKYDLEQLSEACKEVLQRRLEKKAFKCICKKCREERMEKFETNEFEGFEFSDEER